MRTVTNALRATLAERQISQMHLAEHTGIAYGKIRRILRPNSNPRLDDALRIANALEMPLEDLFHLDARSNAVLAIVS